MRSLLNFTPYALRPALYLKNVLILNPDGLVGHALRIQGDRIVAIDAPPQKGDRIIDGQGGVLIPGLINAHDHLELNTFKRLKYRACYQHSRQWIEDIEARFETDPDLVEPRRQPLEDRLLVGALKNLVAGVTTVCHHNPLHKSLRRGYFIRVVSDYGFCHSLFRGDDPLTSYRRTNPAWPWIIHLAEGLDAAAAAEFDELERLGVVQPNTVLVHGVGLTPAQRQTLIERGGGLIWCPASNQFMFGQTACVRELAEAGKLALGSDSRLSGSFDLLAELRAAAQTGQLEPAALFRLVTTFAVQVLRLREKGLGQITVGGVADLVLLPPPGQSDLYAHVLELDRQHIGLVLVGGRPVVGGPEQAPLFAATSTPAALVYLDGAPKLLAQKIVSRLRRASVGEPGLLLDEE
ncbi:MAG: amidohydrolase family protein [Anaerolineae bacterium]|nr:amidohydrolase family protein [Anaerolineae bacterium]